MRMFKIIIGAFLWAVFVYGLFAAVMQESNPFRWIDAAIICFSLVSSIGSIALGITINWHLKNKEKALYEERMNGYYHYMERQKKLP